MSEIANKNITIIELSYSLESQRKIKDSNIKNIHEKSTKISQLQEKLRKYEYLLASIKSKQTKQRKTKMLRKTQRLYFYQRKMDENFSQNWQIINIESTILVQVYSFIFCLISLSRSGSSKDDYDIFCYYMKPIINVWHIQSTKAQAAIFLYTSSRNIQPYNFLTKRKWNLMIQTKLMVEGPISTITKSRFIISTYMSAESSSYNFDIGKIKATIQSMNQKIKTTKEESGYDIIILNGFSGVGKSATALALSGQELYGFHSQKVPVIVTQDQSGYCGVRIQPKVVAGTFQPGFLNVDSRYTLGRKIKIIDMPGQDDNRGINFSLTISYFYVRILQIYDSVKLAYVLKHADIDVGDKAQNLCSKFKVFTDMYGDADKYSQSLILIITKCNEFYDNNDAISYFNNISELQLIRNHPNVLKLVKKLANQQIPILIFPAPKLSGPFLVSRENAQKVTPQYTKAIKDFTQIITKVTPSKLRLLNPPPLSMKEREQCQAFASQARKQVQIIVSKICSHLRSYIQNCITSINPSSDNIEQTVSLVKNRSQFIKSLTSIVNVQNIIDKDSLKTKLNLVHTNFIDFNFQPLLSEQTNKINGNQCQLMINLKNSLITISFLNVLKFNSDQWQWTQLDAYSYFFDKIKEIKMDYLWSIEFQKYERIIQNIITQLLQRHLSSWQDSLIFRNWKQQYKYFPSLIQKISQHMNYKNVPVRQNVNSYFKEIKDIEEQVYFQNKDIASINKILDHNKSQLGLVLKYSLISDIFYPLVESKTKGLYQKITNYTVWSQPDVQTSLKQFQDLNKLNGKSTQKPNYLILEQKVLKLQPLQQQVKKIKPLENQVARLLQRQKAHLSQIQSLKKEKKDQSSPKPLQPLHHQVKLLKKLQVEVERLRPFQNQVQRLKPFQNQLQRLRVQTQNLSEQVDSLRVYERFYQQYLRTPCIMRICLSLNR